MDDWYPEESLERHGIPPDAFHEPGCYALALDAPEDFAALRERWYSVYEIEPPEEFVNAVEANRDLAYIGAASSLCDRLHDHVRGDVRQAGVLGVCPAVGLREVWRTDTADVAFERETGLAIAYSNQHPGVACYCDGDWF